MAAKRYTGANWDLCWQTMDTLSGSTTNVLSTHCVSARIKTGFFNACSTHSLVDEITKVTQPLEDKEGSGDGVEYSWGGPPNAMVTRQC